MVKQLGDALWMVWRVIYTPILLVTITWIWFRCILSDEDMEVRTVSYKEEIDCGE